MPKSKRPERKRKGTSRTSVSLPPETKERMDQVGDSVNWSSVARNAFEAKLADIASKKEKKIMPEVVERLRVSKRKSDDSLFSQGYAAGEEWAKNQAEAEELERLSDFRDQCGTDWDSVLTTGPDDAYGSGERLYFVISPEDDGDRGASCGFWESQLGLEDGSCPKDSLVRGFVEGALEVWDEVKDQL